MVELTLLSRRYERAPRRPPAVLATKLRPPSPPPGAITRPRLLHRLDDAEGSALTVVAAPAGYGKTTLLAQWAASCGRPVAWVTLDERDRDAFRLWAHVGAAFAGALPELGPLAGVARPLDRLLPALAGEIADGRPAVLVLDDHHRLGRGAAEGTLRWFVEQTAPRLQVVIASRVPPPFPLGLLRARGRLVELGPERLRLTEMEAHAVGLAAESVDGWPAGASAAAGVAAQALTALAPAARRFLAEASVLERLDGPACDHVTGRADSAALLRALARETPFLVPLGDGAHRVHRAFVTAVGDERRRLRPARVAELHRRASDWHRTNGEPDEALEHALAAGAWPAAADLLGRTWRGHAERGRGAWALERIERLPEEVVTARLELGRAWLLSLAGRFEEADGALAAAARRSPRAGGLVARESTLVRAAFARDAAVPRGDGPVEAWGRGLRLWLRGRERRAAVELERARAGGPLLACVATALLSRTAADPDTAERLARSAAALASEHGLEPAAVPAALGAALAARGQADEAGELLDEALRRARAGGHPLEVVDALILLAPIAAGRDGRPRAAALLAEAAALLAETRGPAAFELRLERARALALPRPQARACPLTDRELVVLRLLASDRTKREIAAELRLSFNTVHSHTKSIYRKLGAATRAEAVERGAAEALC